ncbi:MAG: hypothetical protein DLM53_05415 [Candidatus Eremiobacter antarcticus]|nr:MAG: hypothetical protein DLM53_05415 [Candidatus Eremiobacter sp. RRmetagenome_bin22]
MVAIAFCDLLIGENSLVGLSVRFIEHGRFVERRQMPQVRLAQHLNEFRQRFFFFSVGEIGSAQFEERVVIFLVQGVARRQARACGGDVARIQRLAANLQIQIDGFRLRAAQVQKLGDLHARAQWQIGLPADLSQRQGSAIGIAFGQLFARTSNRAMDRLRCGRRHVVAPVLADS